ncbi:ankyrin repeat-containing domain protein [Xylariaceae sp. FL0255]|nr:ankyrin repeat-containing domain protein [Xylariaceae sp. FL0255]
MASNNSNVIEPDLERRRLQNRMAQRRFRQRKQDKNRDSEMSTSISANTAMHLPHVALEGASLSGSQMSAVELNTFGSESYSDINFNLDLDFPQLFSLAGDSHNQESQIRMTATTAATGKPPTMNGHIMGIENWNTQMSNGNSTTGLVNRTFDLTPPSSQQSTPSEPRPPTPFKCQARGIGWLNALHMAAQRGQTGILQTLLQQNMDCNEQDSHGLTALMHAVANGHEHAVSLLLDHGAQVTVLDGSRRSVLHWAVTTRREAILRRLLQHIDKDDNVLLLDAYDDKGHTPLHASIESGFEVGVDVLLSHGANLHAKAKKA